MKSMVTRLGEYIEQELTYHSFYKVMAGCTDQVLTIQILLDLSEQSLQHIHDLKALYRSLSGKNYLSSKQTDLSFSQSFHSSVKRHIVLLTQTAKEYATEGISAKDSRVKELFLKLWAQDVSIIQKLLLILLPD